MTPKGFLVRDLHFWISLRRSVGVGKMRAVMMPSPPALETALANSAYPTYWNRSPESVFSSLVHRGEAARWFPSHRGATTCHLGDHESVDWKHRKLPRDSWQNRDTYHHTALHDGHCGSRQSTVVKGSVCVSSWVRPSRVAYSPRMPKRRVSSVFHGMLLVLFGNDKDSEEGSQGLCCCVRRCGSL